MHSPPHVACILLLRSVFVCEEVWHTCMYPPPHATCILFLRSVVVFEEVDMLLDEDKGFVGAVVNLLQSTQVFLMCF